MGHAIRQDARCAGQKASCGPRVRHTIASSAAVMIGYPLPAGQCMLSTPSPHGLATLHDLVIVTAGAKHRHAYHVPRLLKKASPWHGEWYSAHLNHDPHLDPTAS